MSHERKVIITASGPVIFTGKLDESTSHCECGLPIMTNIQSKNTGAFISHATSGNHIKLMNKKNKPKIVSAGSIESFFARSRSLSRSLKNINNKESSSPGDENSNLNDQLSELAIDRNINDKLSDSIIDKNNKNNCNINSLGINQIHQSSDSLCDSKINHTRSEPSSYTQPTINIKQKIALIDKNGNLIDLQNASNVDAPMCSGVIPECMLNNLNQEDILKHFLEYLPLRSISNLKHKEFTISETGIHHMNCTGLLIESKNNKYNDCCSVFINDKKLNKMITSALLDDNTIAGKHNSRLSHQSLTQCKERQSKLICKLLRK